MIFLALQDLKWKAIKLISKPNIDFKKNYKIVRIFQTFRHFHGKKSENAIDYMCYYDNHTILVRVYTPKKKNFDFTVLFFHGGGFIAGDIDSYDAFCDTFCSQLGVFVVSVDYRLAPEHPFPQGLKDCYFIYDMLLRLPFSLGLPKQKIGLLGDSAGANLCASLSLYLRDKKHLLPSFQILLYPCLNSDYSKNSPYLSVFENGKNYILTSQHMEEYISLYMNSNEDLKSPYFAPLNAKNYKNQPDTFLVTAQFDPLRDEALEYGKRLEKGKNRVIIHCVSNVCHGFFADNPESKEAEEIFDLLRQFLGSDQFAKKKIF